MCGIAGIAGPAADHPDAPALVEAMLGRLRHRGPDDGHVVRRPGCVLGARRLSIVDLEHGRQPVANERGDVVAALNGEIYDAAALRADLSARGAAFRTRSDTEVVLRAFERDGEGALPRLEGMFALAVWDGREGRLLLARDRMGEKPLVWFESRGSIVFASEVSALAAHPDCPRDLDLDAVALYLQHRFVPAPRTAVRGVRRLPPANLLRFRDGRASVARYWDLPPPAPARAAAPAGPPPRAVVREVLRRLDAAVASRLAGDVPVGIFLSGGLDSAALAALARRRGPVRTFTLRPPDGDFDEGDAAAATARALGTVHREVRVSPEGLAHGFDEAFARVDEPLGDSSVVAVSLLARAAREDVKAVLGGEGADELFGGYPTYVGARAAPAAAALPAPLRRSLARLAGAAGFGNVGVRWLVRRFLEDATLPPLERHLAWFGAFSPAEQSVLWRSDARPSILDGEDGGLHGPVRAAAAGAAEGDPVDACLRADLLLHLPDALLAKVDRATMLSSLEARAPFLERDLVEYATALPSAWKVRGFATKVVLRRALSRLVPADVLRRRKRGFAVPVSRAFSGALGDRLRDRLRSGRLFRDLLDPRPATAVLDEHARGERDHGRRLYALLALAEWVERWERQSPSARPAPPVPSTRAVAATA